ncbi:MAG: hypothetical protein ACNS60_13635 [Candidatus Cyclobacteriaceae bacterium M2_1C_046]
MLILIFMSACVAPQSTLSRLPSPGKQCKILISKKSSFKKKRSRNRAKAERKQQPEIDAADLQAQLMTDEQYYDQIEKVKKSLPQFDIEKDCPPAFKKSEKKKFTLKGLFKKKK